MSLNGHIRIDQHGWRLSKVSLVPVLIVMPAPARFFLPVSVRMLMRVPVPFCHRVRGFGAAYILALLEFQDPVSGVACARLGSRFRGLWRQTTHLSK